MSDLRRRGSYPIQSAEYSPNTSPPPVQIPIEEAKEPLPVSIRALKNSAKSTDHGRTAIICLDGTGDQFDNDNSNVVHFVSCLKKHTPGQQVTYYQSGIGTYDSGGLKNGVGAALDMAVGSGLGIHIKDAYRFLMQNYREGDKICLFGFSRGAYTVRCLAGMLHKVGLLPASNTAQINFAYNFYKDDSPQGWKMSAEFKKTFCTNVNVYFVGLWDCVASVGFIPRKLPFSSSPTNSIHYFRHAMALDEHRSKFKVCHWQHQDPDLLRRQTIDNTPRAQARRGISNILRGSKKKKEDASVLEKAIENSKTALENGGSHLLHTHDDAVQDKLEAYFEAYDATRKLQHKVQTDGLEVWFMGAHADIGGGAVPNETRHMLSRIPFRWMIRQCFECDTGILFDTAALVEQGLDLDNLWPTFRPISVPIHTPPPALIESYESKKLPPLSWRSAFLPIGEEDQPIKNEVSVPLGDSIARKHAMLSETVESHFDALAPVNDQLKLAKGWWVLEYWPVKIRVLKKADDDEVWEKKVRLNLGRYRAVRELEPKMHWTVQRMIDEGKYTLRSRCHKNTSWQVVS